MTDRIIQLVKGGTMVATTSPDPQYPGIDVEFISDNDNDMFQSRPRVLIEQPDKDLGLRILVWNDRNQEDYTEEILLYKPDGNNLYLDESETTENMLSIKDDKNNQFLYGTDTGQLTWVKAGATILATKPQGLLDHVVRTFAISILQENPNKYNLPVDYKTRCADCDNMAQYPLTWYCSQMELPCSLVRDCPLGFPTICHIPDSNDEKHRMTEEQQKTLTEACNVLCSFCTEKCCEKCHVTDMINNCNKTTSDNDNILEH